MLHACRAVMMASSYSGSGHTVPGGTTNATWATYAALDLLQQAVQLFLGAVRPERDAVGPGAAALRADGQHELVVLEHLAARAAHAPGIRLDFRQGVADDLVGGFGQIDTLRAPPREQASHRHRVGRERGLRREQRRRDPRAREVAERQQRLKRCDPAAGDEHASRRGTRCRHDG